MADSDWIHGMVITAPPSLSAQVRIYKRVFDTTDDNRAAMAAVNEFLEVPYSSYEHFERAIFLSKYNK